MRCCIHAELPQILYDAGWSGLDPTEQQAHWTIGCTQPRRISAVSVAQRVAQERGSRLGALVGYTIQFDNKTSQETRIKYMTDGVLIREMMSDPLLSKYSVIVVDEAHERSVNTDLVLGLVKRIMRKRPELRVIISSATLESQLFVDFFSDVCECALIQIPGTAHPVDVFYLQQPARDYIQECLETIIGLHKSQPLPGDILVFLTGQEEIVQLVSLLQERSHAEQLSSAMQILPLYSGLPMDEQLQIFQPVPRGTRKIILATNIAETSLTIEGIVFVVDCGYAKMRVFDASLNMESLVPLPISKSSAIQRAGRAGRVGEGKCFRMYTSAAYESIVPDHTLPEIQRTNLSNVILLLKSLGIDNISSFDYISRPSSDSVRHALTILFELGALDDKAQLTPIGSQIAQFPIDLRLAKMLLVSGEQYCSEEIVTIAACLSVCSGGRGIFQITSKTQTKAEQARQQFATLEGDHFLFLNGKSILLNLLLVYIC